jgi:hypothetical protein
MPETRCGSWLAALLVAAAPAMAQIRAGLRAGWPFAPGTTAPSLARLELQGTAPFEFGAATAPAVTLLAFYHGPALAAAAGDQDWLGELQRRLAPERGLVLRIVDGQGGPLPASFKEVPVAVDEGGQVAGTFGIDATSAVRFVVLDRNGRQWFLGELGTGLEDTLAAAAAGTAKAGPLVKYAKERQQLCETFGELVPAEGLRHVEPWLVAMPHDGLLWGIAYAHAVAIPDAERAAALRVKACATLAAHWRALAVFVDLAVRAAPYDTRAAQELGVALAPVAQSSGRDPVVQLAALRAGLAAGDRRAVGRLLAGLPKLVRGNGAGSLELAGILAGAVDAAEFREVAEQALQSAVDLGVAVDQVGPVRYQVLRRCAGDLAGARELLQQQLGLVPGADEDAAAEQERRAVLRGFGLNNVCWYTMSRLPTFGRLDGYALGVAELMLEPGEVLAFNEYDTVALALFRNGQVARAVELQEKALSQGGGTPTYQARLQRYRAALPAGDGAGPGRR